MSGAGCLDCGLPYSTHGLDTTLPDEQWRMIHDSDGGLLCGRCIAMRAWRLPGAVAIRARIEFGGLQEQPRPLDEIAADYRAANAEHRRSAIEHFEAAKRLGEAETAALRRCQQLREELDAAVIGRTVEQAREASLRGDDALPYETGVYGFYGSKK